MAAGGTLYQVKKCYYPAKYFHLKMFCRGSGEKMFKNFVVFFVVVFLSSTAVAAAESKAILSDAKMWLAAELAENRLTLAQNEINKFRQADNAAQNALNKKCDEVLAKSAKGKELLNKISETEKRLQEQKEIRPELSTVIQAELDFLNKKLDRMRRIEYKKPALAKEFAAWQQAQQARLQNLIKLAQQSDDLTVKSFLAKYSTVIQSVK